MRSWRSALRAEAVKEAIMPMIAKYVLKQLGVQLQNIYSIRRGAQQAIDSENQTNVGGGGQPLRSKDV
jgi:hypothetical protein